MAAALVTGAPAFAQGGAQAKGGKVDKSLVEAAQKLHASNQGETQAGQLGAQRAQSPEVKAFAERMVTDHQQNDQQLTQMAQSMGASLQGDAFTKKQRDAQKDLKSVEGKSGAAFDKAYMSMMVKEHERDVKEVGKAAKDAHKAQQTELASFLDQTHSHLQMHLDEAKRVQKSLGKGGGMAAGSSGASGHSDTSSSATSPSSTGTGTSGSAASPERSSTAAPPSRESRGDTGGSTPTTTGSPGASGSTESSDTGKSGSTESSDTGKSGSSGSTGSSGTQSK